MPNIPFLTGNQVLFPISQLGAFVTPHGTTQSELENPENGETITRVTLADETDTQRAIDEAFLELKAVFGI